MASTFLENLQSLELLPFLFAVVLGGAVGLEREVHGRPAGLRTHILVCLCATMLISVSRQAVDGEILLGEAGSVVFDPNRMGAGIVTGIGFLGAATVLRIGDLVRGITTAACIWYVAGLGIVIGHGAYALATVGTLVVVTVLLVINKLAHGISPVVYRRITVRADVADLPALAEKVTAVLESADLSIKDVAGGREEGTARLTVFVGMKSALVAPAVVDELCAIDGVTRANWSVLD